MAAGTKPGLDRITQVLRPTVTTRIPRRHIVWDTETHGEYQRGIETQTWALGSYTLLDYNRQNAQTSGQVHTTHQPEDLWLRVTRLCRRGERTVMWCHNLGFDLRTSQAFIELPRLGWHLKGAVLERQAAWCSWTRDNATLLMCDLFSWIPAPLEVIARELGMSKVVLDDDNLEQRCVRDVVITAKAVHTILTKLWEHDLGSFRPTGSGMSYSAFCRHHMTHKIVSHDDETVLALERKAMWTGRCEAWKWGTDNKRTAYEYDFETAYAHIGAQCDVPTRFLAQITANPTQAFQRLSNGYRLLCDCIVTTRVPCVPCNVSQGIAWPIGKFRTLLWDTEVKLAQELCDNVEIHTAYLYRRAPALASYSHWVLQALRDTTRSSSPLWGRVLKSWSRSLTGRLALRYRDWEPAGTVPVIGSGISKTYYVEEDRHGFDLHIGNDLFELGDMHEGFASCPMITGWVMAEARVRLWRAMEVAGLNNVRYVDTDGLIVTSAGKRRLDNAIHQDAAHLPRFKRAYRVVNIRGPRNLDLDLARKVSGVPRKAHYLTDNTYQGEVWRGVSDALQRGEVQCVKIMPRKFKVNHRDTRRIHAPHYHTLPFTINQEN